MKTIGMLAGMSWESTVTYYEVVNRVVAEKLGGLHSAKILMHSVDFGEIEPLMKKDEWDAIAQKIGHAAKGLQTAGAQLIIICTNTMHKLAPILAKEVSIPLLHIADATADELGANGIGTAALLGTKITMTENFYKEKLRARGFNVLLPSEDEMNELDRIIFDELCRGIFIKSSKKFVLELIDALAARGAQGIVLGCTEIPLLVSQADTSVPLFSTTEIHARRAALAALE